MKPLYAFVGGGNMGRALIGGLIAAGHPSSRIHVSDPSDQCRTRSAIDFGIQAFERNVDAVQDADVIVFAVKPQQLREVAIELADKTSSNALYVSVAAGVPLNALSSWLGGQRAIVRCMPNTPALVGSGAAGLVANLLVDPEQQKLASELLEAVGMAFWLKDESLIDAVTALSGSGPAYFFLVLELLERAAIDLGLPSELARNLAIETGYGATLLARQSNEDPATLRKQVTSPGGTTERALKIFDDAGLSTIIMNALRAARDRSIELARQLDN